ncbi:MAG: rhodanese-like domain-containing protein [Thioalkalivibrio sp.]
MKHSEEFLRLANEARSRIQELDPAQVDARREAGAVVIDVRDREEYEQGHMEGAMNVSRGTLEMRIGEVVADKDAPIVCYCAGGNRGGLAADTLQRMGYTNAVSIAGGLKAYLDTNQS